MVANLQSLTFGSSIGVEAMILLTSIFPIIGDIYDSFWESTIDLLIQTWNEVVAQPKEAIPLINASLQLYAALQSLVTGEANEDLTEYWQAKQAELATRLLALLEKQSSKFLSSLFAANDCRAF